MHSFRKGWRINRRQRLTQTNSVFGTMEQSMTSQCLDIGGKLPACGSDVRSPEQAQQSNTLPQREYRNGPQHAGCYHITVNAPAGEKTALAAVFMASCSGFKEVDFCEMNKFVAAISHDHLLLLTRLLRSFDGDQHRKLCPVDHCSNEGWPKSPELF